MKKLFFVLCVIMLVVIVGVGVPAALADSPPDEPDQPEGVLWCTDVEVDYWHDAPAHGLTVLQYCWGLGTMESIHYTYSDCTADYLRVSGVLYMDEEIVDYFTKYDFDTDRVSGWCAVNNPYGAQYWYATGGHEFLDGSTWKYGFTETDEYPY